MSFFVRGLVFDDPKPLSSHGKRTVKLNSDEVNEFINRIIGKAVGVMHHNTSIGRVLDAHLNHQNDVMVDLIIDTSTQMGLEASGRVRNGELKGLSFRSLSMIDSDGVRHTGHYPFEVSLVKDGAVDRSSIVFWGDVPGAIKLSKSGFLRVFTKSLMSADPPREEQQVKHQRVMEATDISESQMAQYKQLKPLLDMFSNNVNDVTTIIKLAEAGLASNKKALTTAFDKGMGDYAKSHLASDDYDRFKEEIAKMSVSGERLPVVFEIAASAIDNYTALLAKGENTVAAQQTKNAIVVPQAATLRVPKTGSNLLESLKQNRTLMESYFQPKAVETTYTASDINKRIAATKVTVEGEQH